MAKARDRKNPPNAILVAAFGLFEAAADVVPFPATVSLNPLAELEQTEALSMH